MVKSIDRCGWKTAPVAVLILLIVGTSGLPGCGLFSTRDPESPTGSRTGGEIALSPEEALERLDEALKLRDPDLYMTVIDSSFSYTASVSAYPEDPAFFINWGFDREESFARNLLNLETLPAEAAAELTFSPVTENRAGDSAYFLETYHLVVELTVESLPGEYDGLAEFNIVRGADGGWRVRSWRDDAGGEEDIPTMSRLRAGL